MKRPTPLDAPREFRINEMFFSTTDRKGRILAGNDVFVRVSGYPRDELVGQPHNIIRHPEMPRAVFRLIWDFLGRGQPVAGLVKNLARDGRYYSVLAFLMPVKGGYLSIRFKPSSELQPVIEELYRQMRDCERDHASRGEDGEVAMSAAGTLLTTALRLRGFSDYESFMHSLLHDELKSRDAAIARDGLALFPAMLETDGGAHLQLDTLRVIYAESRKAYQEINALYAQLDDLNGFNVELGEKSGVVLQQTKDFRFIAFNAALRSARLGEEARSLGVIADYLGDASGRTATIVATLGGRIDSISGKARAVSFNLAAARLQIEMLLSFCAELATALAGKGAIKSEVPMEVRRTMIEDLQRAFATTVDRAVDSLLGLEADLLGLGAVSEDLRKTVLTLQVAQVGGQVEASRLGNDDTFAVMFTDLREGIEQTKSALTELNDVSDRMQAVARKTPAMAAIIASAVQQMSRDVDALACGSTGNRADSAPTALSTALDLTAA